MSGRALIPVIALAEFHAALAAQGVPQEHVAVKCPVCGTVQSFADLKAAHAAADPTVLKGYFGERAGPEDTFAHACIGRYTQAGPWSPAAPTGRGCNWTLDGFLQAHRLLVETPDGERWPAFEPATPQEALQHMTAAYGIAPGGAA